MATLARVTTLLRRDLGAAELRLMWIALVLAATVLSGLGFLAERIDAGLRQNAAALLGGQLVVDADHPMPPDFVAQARALALDTASIAEFPTMALGTGPHAQARLVSLKAVSGAYPLFGAVSLEDADGRRARDVPAGPRPGTAWVARGLAAHLGPAPQDQIRLGARTFRVAGVIASEPDGTGISFAPRVMINAADLDATGLVQPASRVRWRLALRGAPTAIQRYEAWARARIDASAIRGVQLQSAADADVGDALRRGASFLQVVALGATLLSALATAIAARDFAQRRRDMVALLKALGLTRGAVMRMFVVELATLGAVAAGVGCIVGLGLQALVLRVLGGPFVMHDGQIVLRGGVGLNVIGASDGSSNTLMICHKAMSPSNYYALGYVGMSGDNGWLGGWLTGQFEHKRDPRFFVRDLNSIEMRRYIGASHPGGIPSLFADASVRTLSYTTSETIIPRLWSWNDGGIISAVP